MTSLHHQPQHVEQFGIEPVPPELRVVGWFDLFSIFINFLINPGAIIKGGLALAAGLSFSMVFAAEFFGTLLAILFYIAMANVGVDYGLPGQVAARMSFGIRGAKWVPSLLRLVVSTYYFAFQTVVGALAIVAVLNQILSIHCSMLVVSIAFGLLQAAVALAGYESLKILSRLALPTKLAVLGYLLWVMASYPDPNFAPSRVLHYGGGRAFSWLLFASWLNASSASWLSMVTDSADFCRYSSSRMKMWVGVLAATLSGSLITSVFGAYGAAATNGADTNSFSVITHIHPGVPTLLAILVVIGLDNWTINVLNLYTGGLSLNNMWSGLGRFWCTLIVSMCSVALSGVPGLLQHFLAFASIIGNVFGPIAGILVFDYIFVRQMKIDVAALYRGDGPYWYWRGFNPVALAWLAIGFVAYLTIVPVDILRPVATAILTGTGYCVTVFLLARAAAVKATAKPA